MQHIVKRMGLCLAVLAGLGVARPAHAQSTFEIVQTPVNTAQTVQLIREVERRGYFRCPGAATLIQLLERAEATSDAGQRYLIRQQAFLCCSELSRELNFGVPYTRTFVLNSVPTVFPDLKLFGHNALAQVLGRCICQAIADLRDGVVGLLRAEILTTFANTLVASCERIVGGVGTILTGG